MKALNLNIEVDPQRQGFGLKSKAFPVYRGFWTLEPEVRHCPPRRPGSFLDSADTWVCHGLLLQYPGPGLLVVPNMMTRIYKAVRVGQGGCLVCVYYCSTYYKAVGVGGGG